MAFDVTELWSQKDDTQEQNGWGATRYFSVMASSITEMLDGKAVCLAPGIPSVGQSHPNHRDLRVVNKSAGPGLAERIVSARYQWMPGGWTPNQASGDPLTQPPMISWGMAQRSETTDIDVYGNVVCNSAGDVFSNLPSRTLFSLTLRITRWERKFDVFKTRNFVNKVNSTEMVAGSVRFKPRSMLCTFIAPVAEFAAGANAVQMGYEFEIRPTTGTQLPAAVAARPFAWWTIDTGLRSFGSDSQEPLDLWYANKPDKQVTSDVRLNGSGRPVQFDDYVVKTAAGDETPKANPKTIKRFLDPVSVPGAYFLGFDVYEEANFLTLGL